MPFYLYILHSETTNRCYMGQTKHLERRVAYYNSNYSLTLRNRGPWKLAYFEQYPTRSQAVRRERYIKRQKDRRFIESLLSVSR